MARREGEGRPEAGSRARTLGGVRRDAKDCRACDLWKTGTQTVFGEGPAQADVMLVGEQPGDVEDREGRPFVGPAGRLLRETLAEAGLDPDRVYLTNAVKHFKWEPRGKRRIHKKPRLSEITACHPWLDDEVRLVQPAVVVCLGATAARAVLGREVKIQAERGTPIEPGLSGVVIVTAHPSSILRVPERELRRQARQALVDDLRTAAAAARRSTAEG